MNAEALTRKFWSRAMRFARIQLALEQIRREEGLWLEGEWSPLLPVALAYLLSIYGESWIATHPWVNHVPEPPLHAAGFRTEDMRRYRQLITMEIGDRVIHVFPEDAVHLIGDVRCMLAKELGY